MKSIEIDKDKANFNTVYQIIKIDIDKVTFRKYGLKEPTTSMFDERKSTLMLHEKDIGEETHLAKPEIIEMLAGKVGDIIIGFKCEIIGKRPKRVMVTKIIKLE